MVRGYQIFYFHIFITLQKLVPLRMLRYTNFFCDQNRRYQYRYWQLHTSNFRVLGVNFSEKLIKELEKWANCDKKLLFSWIFPSTDSSKCGKRYCTQPWALSLLASQVCSLLRCIIFLSNLKQPNSHHPNRFYPWKGRDKPIKLCSLTYRLV